MRVTNTFRFRDRGRCLLSTTYVALAKQVLGNCGGIQSVALGRSGYTLYRHMPGVASKSGIDFGGLVNMTSYSSNLNYGPADYDDPDEPPSWYVDWLDNGSKWIGFAMGYLPDKGDSRDERRATLSSGWDMRGTKKSYPIAVSDETLLPGDIRTIHAFRCYLDPDDLGSATGLVQIRDTSGEYLIASYLEQAIGEVVTPLTASEGKTVTVLKEDGLQAADTATAEGVVVSVPGSAGHGVVKIT